MYLEYFGLNEFPFTLTPNCNFYCNLRSHQDALETVMFALKNGEGFIKIVGEVGTGKTLLCRKLLGMLENEKSYVSAYIINPNLDNQGLYEAFAKELGIKLSSKKLKQNDLLDKLNEKLLELNNDNKKVVMIIDEAQAIPLETLESLRLLSNLETESSKLLQIVLFGQPELDDHLNKNELRQLKQRITFSHNIYPLTRNELEEYIHHRLKVAGYNKYGFIFTKRARTILFKASNGIPRIINILCHKSLLAAYGYGKKNVSIKSMLLAIKDTESASSILKRYIYYIALSTVIVVEIAVLFFALRII